MAQQHIKEIELKNGDKVSIRTKLTGGDFYTIGGIFTGAGKPLHLMFKHTPEIGSELIENINGESQEKEAYIEYLRELDLEDARTMVTELSDIVSALFDTEEKKEKKGASKTE